MRGIRITVYEMSTPEFYRMAKLGKLDYASFVVWQNCKAGGCTGGHFNALLNR